MAPPRSALQVTRRGTYRTLIATSWAPGLALEWTMASTFIDGLKAMGLVKDVVTFTDPAKVSPSTDETVAPGKHSATDAMSWKCAHVSSTDVGTVKR